MRRCHIGRPRGRRSRPGPWPRTEAELVERAAATGRPGRNARSLCGTRDSRDLRTRSGPWALRMALKNDPQSVHRSRCQHDLVGIAAQPSRRQQVVGDRDPKLATAPRIAIMKMLGAERAHPASRKGPEATQRLTVDVRAAKRQSAMLRLFDDEAGFRVLRSLAPERVPRQRCPIRSGRLQIRRLSAAHTHWVTALAAEARFVLPGCAKAAALPRVSRFHRRWHDKGPDRDGPANEALRGYVRDRRRSSGSVTFRSFGRELVGIFCIELALSQTKIAGTSLLRLFNKPREAML